MTTLKSSISAALLVAAGLMLSGCVDDGYVYDSGRPYYRSSAAVIYDVGPGIGYRRDRYVRPGYDHVRSRDHRHYSSRSIDRTRPSDRYIRHSGDRHDGTPDRIWRRDDHHGH